MQPDSRVNVRALLVATMLLATFIRTTTGDVIDTTEPPQSPSREPTTWPLTEAIANTTAAAAADPVQVQWCDRCACRTYAAPQQHYVSMNCSGRQLTELWPADHRFSTADDEQFVRITFDDNALADHRLPAIAVRNANTAMAFSCRRCALRSLAAGLFADVRRMQIADLSANELDASAFEADIWRDARIVELVLRANRIERLPAGAFAPVAELQRLDLSGNRLRTLSGVLDAMPATLLWLNVAANRLANEPNESDGGREGPSLLRIESLNVANNSLDGWPLAVRRLNATLLSLEFGGGESLVNLTGGLAMPRLRALYIRRSPLLGRIESGALGDLPELQQLHVTGNERLEHLNLTAVWAHSKRTLRIVDLSSNGLRTVTVNATADGESGELPLRLLRLADNPWHCDCDLYRALGRLLNRTVAANAALDRQTLFESEFTARCRSPHQLVSDFLVDLLAEPETQACAVRNANKPSRWIPMDPPAFLRPRQILVTVLSTVAVVLSGLAIGLLIVWVQRRMRRRSGGVELRDTPVRYTTVRNSTLVPAGGSGGRASMRLSMRLSEQLQVEQQRGQLKAERETDLDQLHGTSTFRMA